MHSKLITFLLILAFVARTFVVVLGADEISSGDDMLLDYFNTDDSLLFSDSAMDSDFSVAFTFDDIFMSSNTELTPDILFPEEISLSFDEAFNSGISA